MKKLLVLLVACLFALPLFADDAKVMPAGVGRFYVVPAYSFVPGEYDDDGDYDKDDETTKVFNLSAALEFGVTDWITAALQWTPGYTFWSDTGEEVNGGDVKLNGAFPFFAGAKFQIVGENAPVPNDQFRLAAAVGAQIPMPTPDWEKQAENMLDGDAFVEPASYIMAVKPVFGIGARGYADYILNENVYFNFYTEFIKYFEREFDLEDFASFGYGKDTYNLGHKLTLELEPRYTADIADGVNFEAGLPLTLVTTPETEVNDAGQDDASHVFRLGPSAKFFFTKTPLPLEFKAGYQLPVLGKNAAAQHSLYLQARVYFKAY